MARFFKVGCLGFIGLFIFLIILGSILDKASEDDSISSQDESYSKESKKIAKDFGVSPASGENIAKSLKEVGIEKYQKVQHDELLDNAHFENEKGYRLSTSEVDNIIIYLDQQDEVYEIKYANEVLFVEKQPRKNITDLVISREEQTNLQIYSEETITKLLKAPSTAKFPNILKWEMWKEDGVTNVKSYVDAQNGFGAMIRSEFHLKLEDNTLKSLVMDGQEYIN